MSGIDRLTYLARSYGPTVVLVCLVLIGGGIAATGWLHTNPKTTDVTRHHDRQTAEITVGTAATVSDSGGLYPVGTRLQNKPFYLYSTTPTVTLVTTTAVPDAADSRVSNSVALVYEVRGQGETYWRETRTLAEERSSQTSLTTNATLDVRSVRGEVGNLTQSVGDAARVVAYLEIESEYSTGQYAGNFSETVPLTQGSKTYSIPRETWTNSHSRTTEETVTVERPQWVTIGAVLPVGVGLIGLLATRLLRRDRGDLAVLAYRIHRDRYGEWISAGDVDQELTVTVWTETLEGLVDVAIDTSERVVHDAADGRYVVITDDVVYGFTPPVTGPTVGGDDAGIASRGEATGDGFGDDVDYSFPWETEE